MGLYLCLSVFICGQKIIDKMMLRAILVSVWVVLGVVVSVQAQAVTAEQRKSAAFVKRDNRWQIVALQAVRTSK